MDPEFRSLRHRTKLPMLCRGKRLTSNRVDSIEKPRGIPFLLDFQKPLIVAAEEDFLKVRLCPVCFVHIRAAARSCSLKDWHNDIGYFLLKFQIL